METSRNLKKLWPLIKQKKVLRTLSLMNSLFLVLIIVFLIVSASFSKAIGKNHETISQNESLLISLQQLVLNSNQDSMNATMYENKSFAEYDEVVPFVLFMESTFSSVDPQAEIAIKSSEDQIFIDHFADYGARVKIAEKDAFFEALNSLHNSKYVVKILNFSMLYKQLEAKGQNQFTEVEFVVRLYLN